MNLTHKLSVVALVVLSLITTGMLVQHQMAARHPQGSSPDPHLDLQKAYDRRIARDKLIFKEVADLLKQRQFTPAMQKLQEIRTAHPENSQALVYEAQLHYNLGSLAKAIHGYRLAVDSDPDFVDKKTPLYIGEQIMNLITEGRSKLNREKKLKPGDASITTALEDVYYLQRRIAGGCE